MSDTTHILIVTSDEQLREELLAAIASLGDQPPTPVTVDSMRRGVESARNRAPDLVVVEMTEDLNGLRNFAGEVNANVPSATIAAVLKLDAYDEDGNKTTKVIDALRAGVNDFLHRPVSSAELADLLARNRDQVSPTSNSQGRVISFVSNKGGVGKSTLAVNSAVGLGMRHPGRVLLVDGSLQMGVAASMLDVTPRVTLADAAAECHRIDETMLRQMVTPHDSGVHLLAAPQDAVEATSVDDEVMSRIITLARRTYDFVVVDTFPLFDRVVIAVLDLSDRAYVVLENVVPTVVGAAKMLQVLDGIGFPKERLRVVLNRMTTITGGLSADDVAERLNSDIHVSLPYDKRIIVAANIGQPFVMDTGASGLLGLWNRLGKELQAMISDMEVLHPNLNARENVHSQVVNEVEPNLVESTTVDSEADRE